MTDEALIQLRTKLGGYAFVVEDDPDNYGFFSVYADKDRAGCEVAGKIGERSVAEAIASMLTMLCRDCPATDEHQAMIEKRIAKIKNK